MSVPMPSSSLLRPSPLDLGGVLSGAFEVFKKRLGQFALLALLQGVATGLLVMGAVAVLIVGIFQAVQRASFSALIVWGIVAMILASFGALLIQIKTNAMLVLGAHDTAEGTGQPSSLGDLFRRTKGVAGRMVLLVLAFVGLMVVVYGAIAGIGAVLFMNAVNSGNDSGGVIAALVGFWIIVMLLMLVIGIVAIYLQVRLLYLLPALAVENLAAVDALKRSWTLTKGNVLRTLGFYLVGSIIVGMASGLVQMVAQFATTPFTATQASQNDPTAAMMAVLPVLAITLALQIAVQLLGVPFLQSYVTVMYVDQVRRDQLPAGYAPQQWQQGPGPYQQQAPQQQWGQQPGQWGQGPQQPPRG
ncbi:MAG: glycerophosphoryl diester phosphodiesterase membrane domain-containing protein [Propionibacteriaceae bacterium]|nr:glycerophosphoryl diester phosphodiesterase membrane domain-containing protein [Propionibacteriaceae bacterium]